MTSEEECSNDPEVPILNFGVDINNFGNKLNQNFGIQKISLKKKIKDNKHN